MSSRYCLADETDISVGVLLFLVLYVCVGTVFIFVVLVKAAIATYRAQQEKRSKKSYEETTKETGYKETAINQGMAIKRLLFLKMYGEEGRREGADESYVDAGNKERGKVKNDGTRKQPWETDAKMVKFKRKIGAGNFGEVWMASWMGSTVAVKTVVKGMANNQEFIGKFLEEIELMSSLNHPNVVMFLGACIEPPGICLILEYCTHGNLIDFLQSAKRKDINISMHLILKMALDIARGIKYLHEKIKMIQRDIKGRNVLVDENLNAKIADFGLSRLKTEEAGLTACGTPAWTAPEVVRMEDYTEKVDVYSFAVVLWELFMREEPYSGEGGIQVAYAAAEQGLRPEVVEHMPRRYAELMTQCWADDPDDRPHFSEILERLFQMMKDESNPFKAPEFYFGKRDFMKLPAHIAEMLNEDDLLDIASPESVNSDANGDSVLSMPSAIEKPAKAEDKPSEDQVSPLGSTMSSKNKNKAAREKKTVLMQGPGPNPGSGVFGGLGALLSDLGEADSIFTEDEHGNKEDAAGADQDLGEELSNIKTPNSKGPIAVHPIVDPSSTDK